jgi:hypothetical protein
VLPSLKCRTVSFSRRWRAVATWLRGTRVR